MEVRDVNFENIPLLQVEAGAEPESEAESGSAVVSASLCVIFCVTLASHFITKMSNWTSR